MLVFNRKTASISNSDGRSRYLIVVLDIRRGRRLDTSGSDRAQIDVRGRGERRTAAATTACATAATAHVIAVVCRRRRGLFDRCSAVRLRAAAVFRARSRFSHRCVC